MFLEVVIFFIVSCAASLDFKLSMQISWCLRYMHIPIVLLTQRCANSWQAKAQNLSKIRAPYLIMHILQSPFLPGPDCMAALWELEKHDEKKSSHMQCLAWSCISYTLETIQYFSNQLTSQNLKRLTFFLLLCTQQYILLAVHAVVSKQLSYYNM